MPAAGAPQAAAAREELEQDDRAARLRAVIGRIGRRLRPTRAGAGLTPSQISVLFTIVRRGPIGLAEVAALEALNPTMLSRITAELTDRRLIRRRADPHDRRAALVEATAAGTRMRERIHRERTRALAEHVEALDPEDRRLLWEALPVLEELADSLQEPPR